MDLWVIYLYKNIYNLSNISLYIIINKEIRRIPITGGNQAYEGYG